MGLLRDSPTILKEDMPISLSDEALEALLSKNAKQLDPHTRILPPQSGPIHWVDVETRCASRGCGSSTYIKFKGIPYCTAHTLRLANEELINLGVLS